MEGKTRGKQGEKTAMKTHFLPLVADRKWWSTKWMTNLKYFYYNGPEDGKLCWKGHWDMRYMSTGKHWADKKKKPRGIQADPYSKGLNQTKLLSKNQHF